MSINKETLFNSDIPERLSETGWILVVDREHKCTLPVAMTIYDSDPTGIWPLEGSMWKCPECSNQWTVLSVSVLRRIYAGEIHVSLTFRREIREEYVR